MRRLLLLALVALSACDTPCPRTALPELAACLSPDAGWGNVEGDDTTDLQLALTGVTTTDVAPATDCFGDQQWIGAFQPSNPPVWLQGLDAEGAAWTVGLAAPELEAVGLVSSTDVEITWSFQFGGFSPTVGAIEVRDDGGLAAWIGEAGELRQLALPAELTLEEGGRVCHQSESCGSWEWLTLEATWGGRTDTLEHGSSITFGEHEVLHGGYQRQTSASTNCADWFAANIQAAVIRR